MQSPPLKPFIPPHPRPAPRANLPWWKPERWRSAATMTGYATWGILAVLLLVSIYRIATDHGGGYLPFTQRDGLTGSERIVNAQSEISAHGDGATMQVWKLSGSPSELRSGVTNTVSDNLVWFHRPFDARDRNVMQFVSEASEYQKAAPFVKEIESGDFYFAYSHLRSDDAGSISGADIWLFSPDKMLLVYLSNRF